MNYLTHYYYNIRHPLLTSVSPEFHFGAALPDILSVYDRHLRFHPSEIRAIQSELGHGILNHLEMDAFFHRSVFFKNSYEGIRILLTQTVPKELDIRPFFLAHVLVEILLDHLLLVQSPDLGRRFYSAIGSVDIKETIRLLEAHFSKRLYGLDELINKFLVTRFLESYIDIHNLIYPVNRMLARTRQQVFEWNDPAIVRNIFEPSLRLIEQNIPLLNDAFTKTFMNL